MPVSNVLEINVPDDPGGILYSSLSCLPVHPGSPGVLPSVQVEPAASQKPSDGESLSIPSWHCALGFVSSLSVGPEQEKSFPE